MTPLRIFPPEVVSTATGTRWQVRTDGAPGGSETLWFEVDDQHSGMLNGNSDAALVGLLLPAMLNRQDMVLEGDVTDELLFHLDSIQAVLSVTNDAPRVQVTAHGTPAAPAASGVGAGYSAGVDSYATLARHHYDPTTPGPLRVTHLLYNNVGAHGVHGTAEPLYRARLERTRTLAEQVGLPLVAVDSNLGQFYGRYLFQRSHTPRNAAVAHLLAGGLGGFLYASTFDYSHIKVANSYDIAYADPVTLPLLSHSGLALHASGSELTRFDKTRLVSELPIARSTLDVCVDSGSAGPRPNCSRCWKCLRTLVTLEALGALEDFEESFHLDTYRAHRSTYLVRLADERRHNVLSAEVWEKFRQAGGQVPPGTRVRAERHRAERIARATAKRVLRR